MTWEQLTWEILTWNTNMFWSPSSIWNAFVFYKSLLMWILPLLKTIAYWILIILAVFFFLLFLSNKLSARGRKKIQSEKPLFDENTDVPTIPQDSTSNDTTNSDWWNP